MRTSLFETVNMGEHQELQSATGWTEKRSAVVGYHWLKLQKMHDQNMISKKQDVPCQGNMEYNWMYRGEEGHWISLVGKNAKIGQTEIRKKETETRICAL